MSRNPVLDAIRSRRTVREFTGRPVPRDRLADWLEAARWAPNHRLTEPWRFIVVEKDRSVRREVAERFRDLTYNTSEQLPEPRRSQVADSARLEVLSAPAFVYAFSVPGDDEEVTRENYAACACAVQNIALAAHAEGFALGWSTGRVTRVPGLRELIGAQPGWSLVGALFIGEPARSPRTKRRDIQEAVSWV